MWSSSKISFSIILADCSGFYFLIDIKMFIEYYGLYDTVASGWHAPNMPICASIMLHLLVVRIGAKNSKLALCPYIT